MYDKRYKTWYYKDGRCIAAGVVTARDEDDACIAADYKMSMLYPNVEFDNIRVFEEVKP